MNDDQSKQFYFPHFYKLFMKLTIHPSLSKTRFVGSVQSNPAERDKLSVLIFFVLAMMLKIHWDIKTKFTIQENKTYKNWKVMVNPVKWVFSMYT